MKTPDYQQEHFESENKHLTSLILELQVELTKLINRNAAYNQGLNDDIQTAIDSMDQILIRIVSDV